METSNRRDFLKSGTAAGLGFTINGLFSRKTYSEENSDFNRIVYRAFGSTEQKVSEIGFGAMNMRDPELVHAAIDKGINYIDTANGYMKGANEEIIGQVMKTKRDKVFLTTKISPRNPDNMSEMIETSLRRLQTDHVDLLLLHGYGISNREQVLENAIMKIFDDARDKGYTRFVGFSTHKFDDEISEAALESKFWEAVLVPYNYISPPSVSASIKKVREAGLAVIGMKNLLNFETRPRKPLPDIRKDKNNSVTYAQALFKWVLNNPYVDTIIPGMTSFEQLDENMAIMGTKLSYEDQNILYRFSERIKGSHCFGLAGCTVCKEQCPKGVNVSELNRCLGYVYGYEDYKLARENYEELPLSQRVDVCGDCKECVVKCINGLNLAENVQRARELFA